MTSESLSPANEADLNSNSAPMVAGWRLKVLVFVCGAVLMALEMAGSRVLAIHFGSSIYVWGSIIGIFLAALSLGYYAGGLLSDWRPSFLFLNLLMLTAGLWLLALPFYDNFVCRGILSLNIGDRAGPLLATAVLFGGPSVLLGVVSPFSVRLSARAIERMGNVSGRLYAISTMGSIFGTLMTAFWLIPAIRVSRILLVLGTTLILLPLVVMPKSRRALALSAACALLAFGTFWLKPSPPLPVRADQSLVFESDSAYHYVAVVDDQALNMRMLRFNNSPQSIINLAPPHESKSYTNAFHLARIFNPQLKRILVIGGGGGVGPRAFTALDPEVVVDLVEIDPLVVDVSQRFFYLQEGPRLRIHVEDGRKFVRESRDKYDLIILDAFTSGAQVPFHLTTREFLQQLHGSLAPGGVFLANIFSALDGDRSRIFRSEYKTIQTVFQTTHLFALPLNQEIRNPDQFFSNSRRNIILVAQDSSTPWNFESIVSRAEEIVAQGLAPAPTLIRDARSFYTLPVKINDVPVLTDDFAPVDTMSF
ncbi:MAG TPA: fused MFS/spermidine synthase [Pyrinomonadaceae bacterium]|nr:fused MFS/spermidine synthase [Pyrinomonadaceae bacterium]